MPNTALIIQSRQWRYICETRLEMLTAFRANMNANGSSDTKFIVIFIDGRKQRRNTAPLGYV